MNLKKLYYQKIKNSNIEIIKLALNILNINKIETIHYEMRANILVSSNLCTIDEDKNKLSCYSSVSDIFETVLYNDPSKIYYKQFNNITKNACKNCKPGNLKENHSFLSVDINILALCGLKKIQESIDNCFIEQENNTCPTCNSNYESIFDYNDHHLIIDINSLSHEDYLNDYNLSLNDMFLNDIPITIKVKQKNYRISGFSSYTPEHYVSYVYNTINWKIYDDLNCIKDVHKNDKICPHIIMYICDDNF